MPGLAEWVEHVEALDPAALRRLAENRVAAWGALREVFSERVPTEGRSAERFRERTEERFREIAPMLAQVPARAGRFGRDHVSSREPVRGGAKN